MVMMHISLDRENLNAVNMTTPEFCIWPHCYNNWTTAHMQKLEDVSEVSIAQLHKNMIGQSEPTI